MTVEKSADPVKRELAPVRCGVSKRSERFRSKRDEHRRWRVVHGISDPIDRICRIKFDGVGTPSKRRLGVGHEAEVDPGGQRGVLGDDEGDERVEDGLVFVSEIDSNRNGPRRASQHLADLVVGQGNHEQITRPDCDLAQVFDDKVCDFRVLRRRVCDRVENALGLVDRPKNPNLHVSSRLQVRQPDGERYLGLADKGGLGHEVDAVGSTLGAGGSARDAERNGDDRYEQEREATDHRSRRSTVS